MFIIVCSATALEIGPLKKWLPTLKNTNIQILISGIGMLSSAYTLSKTFSAKKPDLIIQAGIGGSLDETLPLGSVVAIRNEIIGDLGVEEDGKFQSLFEMNLLNPEIWPFKNGKLPADEVILNRSGLTVKDGITVNEISTSHERMDHYRRSGATIESMEGAALHYVSLCENVPFLQVRAISNYAGERNKSKWGLNVAINNLNEEIKNLIKIFTS